jgi:hypothetical protein
MIYDMKLPRSVEIIQQQLADLAEVKATINYDSEFDSAFTAMLASMNVHEQELKEELKAAEYLKSQADIE